MVAARSRAPRVDTGACAGYRLTLNARKSSS